jgi:hypothetical protein
MSLPIYQTDSKDLTLLQTNWAQQLNPVIQLPINKGLILKNVFLKSGVNTFPHLLGRILQGWFVIRQRGSATFYDEQDSNLYPMLSLVLNSSSDVNIDLFVF